MRKIAALSFMVLLAGCSSTYLKVDNPDDIRPNREFEQAVKIEVPDSPEDSTVTAEAPAAGPVKETPSKKKAKALPKKTPSVKKAAAKAPKKSAAKAPAPARREPELESDIGFQGRRPVKDPFWVGENVVHDVSYLGISAGTLSLRVEPFAQVNGQKAYNFVTQIKTYERFSKYVYAADDKAVTLMDFEQMIPRVFTLHVKESSQVREARSFFDFDKMKATYWEKKVTKKKGVEEKKQEWEILPYSQNVFSAAFYMRLFAWETGKEYSFRVADDNANHVFKGTALRRETLDTELGPKKAVVVKAEISTKGVFKPTGDIFIWLSDDERKHILRIEAKIKIGTLVSEVIKLDPGKAP